MRRAGQRRIRYLANDSFSLKVTPMLTISFQDAQANLSELIQRLTPGDEVVITDNQRPVARLLPTSPPPAERKLGTVRGTVLYMAPDFDAPLDDFREYME
jgi:prevent-host-death family protein